MERKTYLKCAVGETLTLRVEGIQKQEVVNIEAAEGTFSIYSEKLKQKLRELYQADRANPNGPLTGKTLKITRQQFGYEMQLVSSSQSQETDEEMPF